jgi:hypothetical protein
MSIVISSASGGPPGPPPSKKHKTSGKENVSLGPDVVLRTAIAALTTGSVNPRAHGNILPSRGDSA